MLVLNIMLLSMVIYLYRQNKRCTFTKLLNKAQFNTDIKSRMRRSTDMIVLIDIDQFKQINDKYGHAQGDQVILKIVDLLKNVTSFSDRVYRIGGDEFAILTCEASVSGRILEGLAQGDIRASVGCGKTYEEADKAMYKCKNSVKKD